MALANTAPSHGSNNLFNTPSVKPDTSVPHKLPTPPTTTTIKESTIYCCPKLGPTLVSCDKATPATPAMPEPKPKVSISTLRSLMPMARAIWRFCDTARTSSPKRVRFITAKSVKKHSRQKIKI